MNQTLLVELLTEELPPKALTRLAESFAGTIETSLRQDDFLTAESKKTVYATPRRLAVTITQVRDVSPDKPIRQKVLPVTVAFDADGNPTAPLKKKLAAMNIADIDISTLEVARDGKNDCLFYNFTASGIPLARALQKAVEKAAHDLPVPKMMTYQRPDGETVEFVRPVHEIVAMHGENVIPIALLGLSAGRTTHGHRFLSQGEIGILAADYYAVTLETRGKVIPGFDARKERIRAMLNEKAKGDRVLMPESLLDEVTALVEWPIVYECHFEESFLEVPQECLILTMQTNQKYFALTDLEGKLRSRFLIVSNVETNTPQRIISGNERVIRPRLSDARFFFEQDKKKRLEDRLPGLANVVYHNKLGTLAQRMARVRLLAVFIAGKMGIDTALVDRAARLVKADLLTEMVGEFPELQGIMGTYYARHDGEPEEVAMACTEHYQPRFAGDALPVTPTGTAVALADKLETLAGIWGIGLQPTGDRDPFALRRHALGILRILIEKKLPLSLRAMLAEAVGILSTNATLTDPTKGVLAFVMDRLRGLLRDRGYSPAEIEAVLAQNPDRFDNLIDKLEAVRTFAAMAESASLAAANKRITNILKKSDINAGNVHTDILVEDSEKKLYEDMSAIRPEADRQFASGDYTGTLKTLAKLHDDVDAFFTNVMVMAEDTRLRNNRIALLKELHAMMNQVADISKLAG
ncbi:glycine--tRNA ligase subunit beta [Oxalobacter sp. OxGP1]|uniref:glycine--tRNA ligase subunit beta n=1 Tax=Oxalobacter paeniformigenes TaxID=2946594 RepID=UPI0022AF738B|nr:glycine--tRNA ligase subunit beta [Oxalobacter paeniformigenes]MCZ4052377.1 glycine--tRNA ligase subunit beta [Oxalobacter paeniformigenes]